MTTAELHARAGTATSRLRGAVAGSAVAATAILLVAVDRLLGAPPAPWVLATTMMGLALATAIPLLGQQDAVEDNAHGHVAVLVPALYLLPWHGVVVAVVVGVTAGWLLRQVPGVPGAPPAGRVVDIAGSVTRAALAATAAGAVATLPAPDRGLHLLLALGGALVFLAVERLLAAAMASRTTSHDADRPAPGRERRMLAVEAAALAFGLLTALVVAAYPAPAVWLALQVAVGTTVALLLSSMDTDRAHHAALLRIAAHAHASMDLAAVERATEDNLAPLVRAARVEIRDLPPGHGDVGTPLPLDAGDPAWLVATHRGRAGHGFSDRDRRLLASAAPLVATAVENARRHTDMTARAATDSLTGIANRRTFEEQLALRLRHSRITDRATALVALDLDAFKAINDQLGHGAGDTLLVEVARRLTSALRAGDLVARVGGDEFAIVAALASVDEEVTLRRRLADRLSGLRASDGRAVGVSLGVAVAPRDGRSTAELYEVADQRMYAVKQGSAA